MLSADDLGSLFDAAVPCLFQRDLVRTVLKCYPEADTARNQYGLSKPTLPGLKRNGSGQNALSLFCVKKEQSLRGP
jgi:hypothetical protein